jgi:hypothetical protein
MHEDDIAIVISEATLCEDTDRIDKCVDMLRCVFLALQAPCLIPDDENMGSVRRVLSDAIRMIEEPDIWLRGRAA